MKQSFVHWTLLGVLALVLVSGCTQTAAPDNSLSDSQSGESPALSATIRITDTGYEPNSVTIAKGGTVTWISETDRPDWPATAQHPTHTRYPGSNIEKCGTAEASVIFDACKALANGESYSFTFNETGEWPFHDHVVAKTFGKIIVVG